MMSKKDRITIVTWMALAVTFATVVATWLFITGLSIDGIGKYMSFITGYVEIAIAGCTIFITIFTMTAINHGRQ
jgi:hypothetical protein